MHDTGRGSRQYLRRSRGRWCLLLTAVLLVSGCGGGEPAPSGTGPRLTEIRIASYVPGPATTIIELADRKGIFQRHGLQPVRTENRDLAVVLTALSQGDHDVAISVPTMVLAATAKGRQLQIVTGLQRSTPTLPNNVWITKDPSIDTIEELKGKTVAVPALVGQASDAMYYLLQRRGISRAEVTFVALSAGITDQLRAGRIDAAVIGAAAAGPEFHAHPDPIAQAVFEASGGTVDSAMTFVFTSTPDYTRKHPQVIRAFRAALNEAKDYLESHEAERRELLQSWAKLDPELARRIPLLPWRIEVAPEDLRPYVAISKAVGTIDAEPDLTRLVWQDHP